MTSNGTLEQTWFTYQEAAVRVEQKVRTINRWRAAGMPMTSGIRDGQRVRLVEESVLLAWWRSRMAADPVHQLRMHKLAVAEAREFGEPEPPRPVLPRRQRLLVAASPVLEPDPADEDDTAQSERPIDWDSSSFSLKRGAEEWMRLQRALLNVDPGCNRDTAFIADRVDAQQAHSMAQTCSACPALELCAAFAEASRPASGFWAGEVWPRKRSNLAA